MSNTRFHGIKSLAEIYAKKHQTTHKQAEERVREMVDLLEEGIADPNYNGIQFVDSITLRRVVRRAKLGRNPKTKEEILIPSRIGIKAEIGKNFSNRLQA